MPCRSRGFDVLLEDVGCGVSQWTFSEQKFIKWLRFFNDGGNMTLKIEDSRITKESILEQEGLKEETKSKIKDSEILIIPNDGFRDSKSKCFPEGTSDFYKLAKQELTENSIFLCSNEGEEQSLTLHSGEIWIPVLMVSIDPLKDVIIPTILNFVANYIFYKFTKDAKDDKVDIHLKVIVENKKTKQTKKLTYDGNVSGLKAINLDAKDIFK